MIESPAFERHPDPITFIACADLSFEKLAEVYNATRIDYLVPMPMNARRMEDYVRDYDVCLEDSIVVQTADGHMAGLGMIAYRQDRAWLTRLGVCPDQRQRKLGQIIMEAMMTHSHQRAISKIQLEVIKGNEPAHRLFLKLGFHQSRELIVLSRPAGSFNTPIDPIIDVQPLSPESMIALLDMRPLLATSWLDESASIAKSSSMIGFQAAEPNGAFAWVICRKNRFQLSHFAVGTNTTTPGSLIPALFEQLYRENPSQDSKFENLAADSPVLDGLKAVGFIELFRRIEMRTR